MRGFALVTIVLALALAWSAVPVAGSTPTAPRSDRGEPGVPRADVPRPDLKPLDRSWGSFLVATVDTGALHAALVGLPHEGVLGPRPYAGLSTVPLSMPGWVADRVRQLPSTLAVVPDVRPDPHVVDDPDIQAARGAAPTNLNSTINHGAQAAWARGFLGTGVRIAVVDDGVDFTHPDLQGTQARFDFASLPPAVRTANPQLAAYDGWPIAFDPASMTAYFADPDRFDGTWYANTSSTDRNVTHTIRVDGKNDFWTDRSEEVGTDPPGDMADMEYDVTSLYATHDATSWYFGFATFANHTNMSYTLYVNTTTSPPYARGATIDPTGKLVDAVAGHRPEFAVHVVHNGLQGPGAFDKNDTIEAVQVYAWNATASAWDPPANVTDPAVGGAFAYSGFKFVEGEGFLELSLRKAYLGSPVSISLELFTTGVNASHAQDTSYSDPNVAFAAPDWAPSTTTLSAFTEVGPGYWTHTYVRPGDVVNGQPNRRLTWPVQYIVTGTSQSGRYLFGDLPDDNYPLTRILVVDEAAAGVYDTVYVDLDHNKDFRNDKSVRRYDELAWADPFDPAGGVRAVAVSPNGSWIASGGGDHTVRVWDVSTGSEVRQIDHHAGRVTSVAFSRDGSRIAAGFDDASGSGRFVIGIWDTATWTLVRNLTGHTAAVTSIAWSASGANVLSGSRDGTARWWTVATGAFVGLPGVTGPVLAVAVSPAGNVLAVGEEGGFLRTYTPAPAPIASYDYTWPVSGLDVHPNEDWIAGASLDGSVFIYSLANGTVANVSGPHFANPVLAVAWSSGGRLLSSSEATTRGDPTIIRWSVANWDNFFEDRFAFSAHVDDTKGFDVPAVAWLPGGAAIVSGGMDGLAKTWTSDLVETTQLRGHAAGHTDTTRFDAGDGIPDVSGGMVYFIARNELDPRTGEWKTPLPYAETFAARRGLDVPAPANGTLVAFMGALDSGQGHGTLVASSIVGQGRSRLFDPTLPLTEPAEEPQVVGFAPNAKIIPVANVYVTNFVDGWWFAVQGYDGVPGTGDEAMIVSNSFGFGSTFEDGWDFYSRFADYLGSVYAPDDVLFTVSSGNSGNGYGTVTSPASAPAVVSVGASTDFYYRKVSGLEGGLGQSFGDIVPFSGRGPTALGRPDPDVVANGRMGVGATALNMMPSPNGAIASGLWSGTSLSSPTAAGILALIYDAYRQTTGAFPRAAVAKSILMSGSDDLGYDVFSQGAGFANADRATKVAANLSGFEVSPNVWVPGAYKGTAYEAFASFVTPGTPESRTFTVRNADQATALDLTVSDGVYRRTFSGSYAFTTTVDTGGQPRDAWSLFYVTTPLAFALSGPGIYHLGPAGPTFSMPIDLTRWIDADLARITVAAVPAALDPNLDGTNDYRYMVDVFDWTQPMGGSNIPDIAGFGDLNRMTINHPEANIFEAKIQHPATRTHDGMAVGTRVFGDGAAGIPFTLTLELYERVDWNWVSTPGTVSLGAGATATLDATITVPSGTPLGTYEGGLYLEGDPIRFNRTYDINQFGRTFVPLGRHDVETAAVWLNGATVAEGPDYALHRGGGLLNFTFPLFPGDVVAVNFTARQASVVPVAATVATRGSQFSFGGTAPGQDDLFGSWVAQGFGNGGKDGDWRFYYTDLADQGMFTGAPGLKFLVDARWQGLRTDIDVFAFSPGGAALPGTDLQFPLGRYGPYTFGRNNGGSEQTSTFFTTTGINEEIVAPGLLGGLNVIALRQVRSNGTAVQEDVSGDVGIVNVNPSEVSLVTNRLAGSRDVSVYSSLTWNGVGAVSAGPSAPVSFTNLPIPQDVIEGDTFIGLLAKGSFTYPVRVQRSALIFAVHITSDPETTDRPNPDLDLGVFLDGLGPGNVPDGVAQVNEFIAYGADPDADEQVRLIKPTVQDDPDTPGVDESVVGAPYLIKVLGFTVPWSPYGTFNMDITLVQGEGFSVSGTSAAPVPPFTVMDLTLSWNLPGSTPDGSLLGALYVGPANAPLTLLVPIEIVVDRSPPVVESLDLAITSGERLNDADNRTTTDRTPSFVASLADNERGELDATRVATSLDGVDVTPWTIVSIAFGPNALGIQGLWSGTAAFTPTAPLSEGVHTFSATVGDLAGNTAGATVLAVVDTTGPPLTIDGDLVRFTQMSTATLTGTTEPGGQVLVRGTWVPADTSGRWSVNLALVEGVNDIDIRAADWFDVDADGNPVPGNDVSSSIRIVSDARDPTFGRIVPDPAGLTSASAATIRGTVSDEVAPGVAWDASRIRVTVNAEPVWPRADGTFAVTVLLSEGTNAFDLVATDLAGNTAAETVSIVRDSVAPALELDALPATGTSASVNVTGRTEPGGFLTINGLPTSVATDGTFDRGVTLSPGMNAIVVRSEDTAGNVAFRELSVRYVAPERAPTSGLLVGGLAALFAALLTLVGFLYWTRTRAPEEEAEVAVEAMPEVEEVVPEELEKEIPEAVEEIPETVEEVAPEEVAPEVPVTPEAAPVVEAPAVPSVEERAQRIEGAFRSGRISRVVYERNLAALGVRPTIPAPAPPKPPAPQPEERAARLRDALEAGKITREAYEANLRKLGLPVPEAKPAVPTAEDRVTGLRKAFEAGKLSREAYEANLARLGQVPPSVVVEARPPAPSMEDRAASLRRAFEAGKMTREAYEENLRRLGIQPEAPAPRIDDTRLAALRSALSAGKLSRDAYAQNLIRLLDVRDAKADPLRRAFVEGKITIEMFEENLRRLR